MTQWSHLQHAGHRDGESGAAVEERLRFRPDPLESAHVAHENQLVHLHLPCDRNVKSALEGVESALEGVKSVPEGVKSAAEGRS
eukprot:4258771-Pyramimonas_sp.AAC.1